jgi:hypothetical protein
MCAVNTVQQNGTQMSPTGGPLVDIYDDKNNCQTFASLLSLGFRTDLGPPPLNH